MPDDAASTKPTLVTVPALQNTKVAVSTPPLPRQERVSSPSRSPQTHARASEDQVGSLSVVQGPHTQDSAAKTSADGSSPATPVEGSQDVLLLSKLHPQLKLKWPIHAHVLAKGTERQWNTWSGAGRLFETQLIDSEGNTMKATVFNDGIEKFGDILVAGATCALSGGRIKYVNAAFSSDLYELTFDDSSSITTIPHTSVSVNKIALPLTQLSSLHTIAAKEKVNVLAVFHDWAASKRVKTAQGKDLTKRDILLVDATLSKTVTTMWGHRAAEDVAAFKEKPVLIKGAQVTVFNGNTTLNVGTGSTTIFDPHCSEAADLQNWYNSLPPDQQFA